MVILVLSYACMDVLRHIKVMFVKLPVNDKLAYTVLKHVLPY